MLIDQELSSQFLLFEDDETPEIPLDDPDETELSGQGNGDDDDEDDWAKEE